jgi:hypothetical protein
MRADQPQDREVVRPHRDFESTPARSDGTTRRALHSALRRRATHRTSLAAPVHRSTSAQGCTTYPLATRVTMRASPDFFRRRWRQTRNALRAASPSDSGQRSNDNDGRNHSAKDRAGIDDFRADDHVECEQRTQGHQSSGCAKAPVGLDDSSLAVIIRYS